MAGPSAARHRPLVITPTYNEAENIAHLLEGIWVALPAASVLVIDDASGDGTRQILDEYRRREPQRLATRYRAAKLGLGTAYLEGFAWARQRSFDAVVQMDADLSHDPTVLPRMLDLLAEYPVVVGSRYVPGGATVNWSLWRRILSRFSGFYARTILGLPARDPTSGYIAWRSEVLAVLGLEAIRSEGYSFLIELKHRAWRRGYRLHETPITFVDRSAGRSKMSFEVMVEAVIRVWLMRWYARR